LYVKLSTYATNYQHIKIHLQNTMVTGHGIVRFIEGFVLLNLQTR